MECCSPEFTTILTVPAFSTWKQVLSPKKRF